jgi:predicted  nucleic acid-binding Zn-ribbon protein
MFEKDKMEQAMELQEARKSELYREDGGRLFGAKEHEEREAAIRQEFAATMAAIEAGLDEKIAGAEESLLVAENSDPTDVLTTEELSSASARRPFVSDEVYTMELDKLVDRCRAVLAQGDRPAMFLYALYANQRVGGDAGSPAGEYLEKKYGNGETTFGEAFGGIGFATGAEAEAVREVVAELRRKLDPDGEKKREAARKAVEESRSLKKDAYLRRRGARSAGELYLKEKYRRVG